MSRKRRENFTGYDKDILLHLIEPHKGIIESKKNYIKTLQDRTKLWESIRLEFNGDSAIRVQRTVQELKDLYKRLKVEAKKQYTEYNKQIRTTGGGEKPQSPDKHSKAVFSLIPQAFVSYNNPYDDDNDSNDSVKDIQDSLSKDNTNKDRLSLAGSCVSPTPSISETATTFSVSETPTPSSVSETPTPSSVSETSTPSRSNETVSYSEHSFTHHQAGSCSTQKKNSPEKSLEEVMKKYAEEEHALRIEYLREKKKAKLELISLKKQNEISKAELLARKISRLDQSIPPLENFYQNL